MSAPPIGCNVSLQTAHNLMVLADGNVAPGGQAAQEVELHVGRRRAGATGWCSDGGYGGAAALTHPPGTSMLGPLRLTMMA